MDENGQNGQLAKVQADLTVAQNDLRGPLIRLHRLRAAHRLGVPESLLLDAVTQVNMAVHDTLNVLIAQNRELADRIAALEARLGTTP